MCTDIARQSVRLLVIILFQSMQDCYTMLQLQNQIVKPNVCCTFSTAFCLEDNAVFVRVAAG